MRTSFRRGQKEPQLLRAIEEGDVGAVRNLVDEGASISGKRILREASRCDLDIPLVLAVKRGEDSLVRALIQLGADVNQVGVAGFPPLAVAAMDGQVEVSKTLLENGADVNLSSKGQERQNAICLAAFYCHPHVVDLLLDNGARPDDVLKGSLSSLIRIPGSILRSLVAAGGRASPEIQDMLDQEQALGD